LGVKKKKTRVPLPDYQENPLFLAIPEDIQAFGESFGALSLLLKRPKRMAENGVLF
jgi:hypothetical protein